MTKWYKEEEIKNFPRPNNGRTNHMLCIPEYATSKSDYLVQGYTGGYWEVERLGETADVILFSELPDFPQELVDEEKAKITPPVLDKFNVKGTYTVAGERNTPPYDWEILLEEPFDITVEAENKYFARDNARDIMRVDYLKNNPVDKFQQIHVYVSNDIWINGEKLWARGASNG